MASSASTSTASIEPAADTNSTGSNEAKSCADASQDPTTIMVLTLNTENGLKATHGGYGFTYSSRDGPVFRWRCVLRQCGVILKTYRLEGQHYLLHAEPHNEEVHNCESSRPSGGGVRTPCTPHDGPKTKAESCADKVERVTNKEAEDKICGHGKHQLMEVDTDSDSSIDWRPRTEKRKRSLKSVCSSSNGGGAGPSASVKWSSGKQKGGEASRLIQEEEPPVKKRGELPPVETASPKPPDTVNSDAQVPAKKSIGHRLLIVGAFSHRPPLRDRPPRKAEGATGDNIKTESTKESGAGNLVDNRASEVRRSPVHVQHPGGSNKPETSAWPFSDQGAKESKLSPPPTPALGADDADTIQNDAFDGAYSCFVLSDDSMNGDIEEKPGAVKQQAGDTNSRDAKAGGKGSLDPPFPIASYESMRNGWKTADDSAGIALIMRGLGRKQIVLNMNLKTGDPRDKELSERLLSEERRLLQAKAYLVAQQRKTEALLTQLLSKKRNSNMADNKR
ncbi:uncharacterized protein LOC8052435 isoform X2 [Ixodes scapularis]|uniref:uncharacterized protein LOC8052435 isoform X2 n=1 Tax=Ixodes scapularis TaxID=6945 RepID=UPI001AD68C82|nr:uncharacterized protein LOC8052435 isoform X2 [Ixodes scapularis]